MTLVNLISSDVEQANQRFDDFHTRYAQHFATRTRDVSLQAKQYTHGQLIRQKRGNLMEFQKRVPQSDSQALHHCVANSPWEDQPVLTRLAADVSRHIGDAANGSLHIDESGFPKQGKHSVGVKRQYCGRLGKVDNCQMGVFLGYTHGHHRMLLDKRLYLPEEWASDLPRRRAAGVPDEVTFQTKAQLGLEMLNQAREHQVPYAWIGMDTHYGQQPWLLAALEEEGEVYIADVPCDTRVWLECPQTHIPPRKGKRGRKPTKRRVVEGQPPPVEVRQLADQHFPESARRVYVRDTERGELWTRLVLLRVFPVRDQLPGPATWLLLREDEGQPKRKYQLCNAAEDTSFERIAQMSHSRYWMERAIQDAKGDAGLDEYQLRGWRGWHHHMTLTFLAMLFLLELQLEWKPKASLLTLKDVREILDVILPKRHIDKQEILRLIESKHQARLSARRSHHRRQKQKRTDQLRI